MTEITSIILKVLETNKPIAANIHPAIKGQDLLDKAIEITQWWVDKEVGIAIQKFYENNGIRF